MRQDSVNRGKAGRSARDAAPAGDVRFDLPPVFGGDDDRRMAQRAEAQWQAARAPHAAMPGHRDMATGAAGAFADHALLLDLRRGDRVDVLFAGAAVTAALVAGDAVTLVGFGTFSVKKRAARKGRNPKTGEAIDIAASTVPDFKAGKSLKDAVA